MAVSNARLQAEARARILELAAPRRRIVEAADAQRRRLERELRQGAEQRLASVSALLTQARENADEDAAAQLSEVEAELDGAQAELRDFAQGIHPTALTEGGLAAALPEPRAGLDCPSRFRSVGRLAQQSKPSTSSARKRSRTQRSTRRQPA